MRTNHREEKRREEEEEEGEEEKKERREEERKSKNVWILVRFGMDLWIFYGNYEFCMGLCIIEPCDMPKTRCVKCVPKCASARVAPSNIVYYCTDIDPQGKVN